MDEPVGMAVEMDAVGEFFDDAAEAAEDDTDIEWFFDGFDGDRFEFPGAGGEVDGERVGEKDGHEDAGSEEAGSPFSLSEEPAGDKGGDDPVERLDEEEEDLGEDEKHRSEWRSKKGVRI